MHTATTARAGFKTIFSCVLIAMGTCSIAIGLVLIADPGVTTSFGHCLNEHQHLMDWLVLVPLMVLYVDTCVGGAWSHWRLALPLLVVGAMVGGQALGFVELWQLAVVLSLAGANLLAKQWLYQTKC
jgi:hypothetical protein